MGTVRKPAREGRLDRNRSRLDEPGAIVDLCPQQILDALAVGGGAKINGAAAAQRDERLSGGISVGQRSVVELRPSAVRTLRSKQVASGAANHIGRCACPR